MGDREVSATQRTPPVRRAMQAWTDSKLTLALPAILLVGLLAIFPLARLMASSFGDGFAAYGDLADSRTFASNLETTFELGVIATVLCVLLGYPVAYLVVTLPASAGRAVLLLVLLPFWVSILVRTYAWTALLGRNGLVNDALLALNLREEPAELLYNRFAVMVGMVHYLLPYMILALYAGFTGIDRTLLSAARTMGAGPVQAFVRVFLPLSRPSVFAGAALVFVIALGFFVTPALLGSPAEATISVYIERQTFRLQFADAAAAAMLLTVIAGAIFYTADRFLGADRLFSAIRAAR
jgi:putative spermidine/putrescine transport system permease protein